MTKLRYESANCKVCYNSRKLTVWTPIVRGSVLSQPTRFSAACFHVGYGIRLSTYLCVSFRHYCTEFGHFVCIFLSIVMWSNHILRRTLQMNATNTRKYVAIIVIRLVRVSGNSRISWSRSQQTIEILLHFFSPRWNFWNYI